MQSRYAHLAGPTAKKKQKNITHTNVYLVDQYYQYANLDLNCHCSLCSESPRALRTRTAIPSPRDWGRITAEENGNNQSVQDGDRNEAPPPNPTLDPAHLA